MASLTLNYDFWKYPELPLKIYREACWVLLKIFSIRLVIINSIEKNFSQHPRDFVVSIQIIPHILPFSLHVDLHFCCIVLINLSTFFTQIEVAFRTLFGINQDMLTCGQVCRQVIIVSFYWYNCGHKLPRYLNDGTEFWYPIACGCCETSFLYSMKLQNSYWAILAMYSNWPNFKNILKRDFCLRFFAISLIRLINTFCGFRIKWKYLTNHDIFQ